MLDPMPRKDLKLPPLIGGSEWTGSPPPQEPSPVAEQLGEAVGSTLGFLVRVGLGTVMAVAVARAMGVNI